MPTYEFTTFYHVWKSSKVVADDEEAAWELYDSRNREDDIEIETSFEDVNVELCDD